MKIYFINVSNINREDLCDWYNTIDNSKKQRIDNIKDESIKLVRIASDHLARLAVSKHLNIPHTKVSFCYGKHGKPLLPKGEAYFNISHSGNYIVCCVDDSPCGIDIEIIKDRNLNAAKRFCTDNEMQYINRSVDKNVALLEIWTKKEAYFKSFGCGIATCLTALDTLKTKGFATKVTDEYVLTVYSENNIQELEILNI